MASCRNGCRLRCQMQHQQQLHAQTEWRFHQPERPGEKPEGLAGVCHAAKQRHQLQGVPQRTLLAGWDDQVIGEGLTASQLAQPLQSQLQYTFQPATCLATVLEHLTGRLCFWQTLHTRTDFHITNQKHRKDAYTVFKPLHPEAA